MRNFTIIEADQFVPMPWRNGAGSTVELIKRDLPCGSGFAWRLSMAAVVEDGQFSDFSGYDRTLVLLEGEGLTLNYADNPTNHQRDNLTKPLQFAQFDGGSLTVAELHGGSIKDLNVMTRCGVCRAQTTCGDDLNPVRIDTVAETLLAISVKGCLTIVDPQGKSIQAPVGALALLERPEKNYYSFRGSAFIVVEILAIESTPA